MTSGTVCHLLVDISAHGFGHVSQTAPLVNELARCVPGLRVTLRTAAPLYLLRQRFSCEFAHIPYALDFGMQMASAVEVKVKESAAAYRAFHAEWEARVAREAAAMQVLQPDLLLANVPYLSLAAAKQAKVRSVALCSLNWADIYRHYCAQDAVGPAIHEQMLEAYNSAEVFFKVQPAMPMPQLRNARSINPIANIGRNQREKIRPHLSLSDEDRLVLVGMGGMEYRLPMQDWPRFPGVHWLVPQGWNIAREDMIAFESLGRPFSDVLASCDAVLTKPGYGTFAEAACAGVPLLYVSRKDWPEERHLVQWLQQNGVCLEVGRERLQQGELQDLLAQLWTMPKPAHPQATGASEAAQLLLKNYF